MKKHLAMVAAVFLLGVVAVGAQDVVFHCNLDGSKVEGSVAYLSARGVFRYSYVLSVPAGVNGRPDAWAVDVSSTSPQPASDPALVNDASRELQVRNGFKLVPTNAVTVGMQSPDRMPFIAAASISKGALWNLVQSEVPEVYTEADILPVGAGTTLSGFVLESKSPPDFRTYRIWPAWSLCTSYLPEGAVEGVVVDPALGFDYSRFVITGTVLAPRLLGEIERYNGGGQKAADVNLFLSYSRPLDSMTTLPAGTTTYGLLVFYSPTLQPATFAATLNGVDIAAQFHPAAGGAELVTLALGAGRNVLSLSADGLTARGRAATDTDRLIFKVE